MAFSDYIADYFIFIIFIVGTTIWPLWTKKKTPQTKASYVFAAGGGVSMGAMMMSLARGTLGVRTFLGSPSELFYRGSSMWEIVYGMAIGLPLVSVLFTPVYYSLGITSVYQYLDLRYKSRSVRCIASATYIMRQTFILGATVFTPCVALNTILGFPYWVSLMGITAISMLFTVFGGLKSAIKADVIQGMTMILISFAIIVQCCIEVKGVTPIFTVPYERQRLQFFTFSGDLTVRIDTLSATIGQLFMSLSLYGCQQNFVQRYCSMQSHKEVKKTLSLVSPLLISLFSLSWICGMGIFATYADCDPLTNNQISKMDEILPFFIMDKFKYFPGMMGLFLGSLFNGALSISVSNINSVATVTYEDFICHIPAFRDLKDKQQLLAIKVLGIIFSLIVMGSSFCIGLLSGVMESGILLTSATSGPLLGVFLLAMYIPCSTWIGAIAGMLSSHAVIFWIMIGHFIYDNRDLEMLPLSTSECLNETVLNSLPEVQFPWSLPSAPLEINTFFNHNATEAPILNKTDSPLSIYLMTYMYYALLGTIITIVVGVLVSLMFKIEETDVYDEKLLHPFALKFFKRFPGYLQRYARCEPASQLNGVPESKKSNLDSKEFDNLAFEMCHNVFNGQHTTVANGLSKETKITVPPVSDLCQKESHSEKPDNFRTLTEAELNTH